MTFKRSILLAIAGTVLVSIVGCAGSGMGGQHRIIYHINEGTDQATNGLRNANNQLSVTPDAKIVFVAHARGVDYLLKGAKDKRGNKYEDLVEGLKRRGVQFEICEITLKNRKMTKDQFIEYATFVPSGVGEVTRLQQDEGFAYLKP